MLGAVIGDIVGSRFEQNNFKGKEFEFFNEQCRPTDDSIMTLAVAKAIMETEKQIKPAISGFEFAINYDELLSQMAIKYMQEFGRRYPYAGYGSNFMTWILSDKPKPYGSFGNGSAMRISPAGLAARTEDEAISLSGVITEVSHNSEEGLMGAEAVAVAIFMANQGYLKSDIHSRISLNYYPLDFTIADIRPDYHFNVTCQGSVPQAIQCFLESSSFEDTIRLAVSLGGDSDTIAAIAGSIAGAYYGIPEDIKAMALSYLDDDLRSIVAQWDEFIGRSQEQFKFLTKYIGKFAEVDQLKGAGQTKNDWSLAEDEAREDPTDEELPAAATGGPVECFIEEMGQFAQAHPEYDLMHYEKILKKGELKSGGTESASIQSAKGSELDESNILASIMKSIQVGSSDEASILQGFNHGTVINWLKQLKDIDDQSSSRKLREIYLEIGKIKETMAYSIVVDDDESSFFKRKMVGEDSVAKPYLKLTTDDLIAKWNALNTQYWELTYPDKSWPPRFDGEQWLLFVRYEGLRGKKYEGDNNYPDEWGNLLKLFWIEN